MELKRAKEVLEGMASGTWDTIFSADRLSYLRPEISVLAGDEGATINGTFTSDDLEAIATWMRDPEGVVKA